MFMFKPSQNYIMIKKQRVVKLLTLFVVRGTKLPRCTTSKLWPMLSCGQCSYGTWASRFPVSRDLIFQFPCWMDNLGCNLSFFFFMEGMEFSKQPTKISGEDSAFTMEYVPPTFREAPDGNGFWGVTGSSLKRWYTSKPVERWALQVDRPMNGSWYIYPPVN